MKKLLLFIAALVLTLTSFTQNNFESISFYSVNRIDIGKGVEFEEVNTFNISIPDRILVHNRFVEGEKGYSQIYKLTGFEEKKDDNGYIILHFNIKSDIDTYELFLSEDDEGEFVLLNENLFFGDVYNLKIDR